ncbi:glycosyltransferase family 2 protein [Massilia agri]|uniref:Glycosyltransferase family 2 protein n=1 Tax=Massilia agri TaxID=1886785 RepID=A0ABT2AJA5_9BURK|nr:glycosyltransferase family 2 protein [Massilia agri]MCS0596290.1 glycosyltransferase family 2 protein [Massilia agri]
MHTPSESVSPAISIVSTMYRSRSFLERFLAECLEAVKAIGCHSFEIVLVNDGSPDDSLEYAVNATKRIPELVVVDLSRNFGHHYAMQAGLQQARGERVFLIDSDLEVSPLTLIEFKAKQDATGADVVYGYQEARKGGMFEKASGGLFYTAFNLLSDTKIPPNLATERIMTRRYVDALLRLGDRNLFMAGMMSWAGFTQIGMPLKKTQREGESTYTLLRRVKLMVNAVSSFSVLPLTWLFNIGVSITLISFLFLAYLLGRKILFDDTMIGYTSLMGLMALSLGVTTTSMGLIGIYLGKVFSQVQNRPTYIIKDIYGRMPMRPAFAGEARESEETGCSY